jgi:hypothetical protein
MSHTEVETKLNLLSIMLKRYCGLFEQCEVPNQDRPAVKVNIYMTFKNLVYPNLTFS